MWGRPLLRLSASDASTCMTHPFMTRLHDSSMHDPPTHLAHNLVRARAGVMQLPGIAANGCPRYRLLYEGCDGTSAGLRGIWRVATATSS